MSHSYQKVTFAWILDKARCKRIQSLVLLQAPSSNMLHVHLLLADAMEISFL